MQEQELIQRCVEGNRISQRELYDMHKSQMYTLAYRITNSFEDADDVLQEGFLNVFRNLQKFNGNSKLSTWIHTIIIRTAYRKIKNTIQHTSINSIEVEESVQISYPSDIEYLEKAIQGLPDGYRTIFTLFEIEGFKHHEIAEILAISINTSKSQLRNAKILLRHKLKNVTNHG